MDKTGYLDDAVSEAAEMSGVSDYSIEYLDPEEDWKTAALRGLAAAVKETRSFSLVSLPASAAELLRSFMPSGDSIFLFLPAVSIHGHGLKRDSAFKSI